MQNVSGVSIVMQNVSDLSLEMEKVSGVSHRYLVYLYIVMQKVSGVSTLSCSSVLPAPLPQAEHSAPPRTEIPYTHKSHFLN